MNALERKFRLVPPAIREWFGSDAVDEVMFAIDAKYNLPDDETVIPSLLFSVEIGDLAPEDMPRELAAQLSISTETAEAIYQELKAQVLNPIAPELIAFGVGKTELAPPDTREQFSVPSPLATPSPLPAAAPIIDAVRSETVQLPQPLGAMPKPVSLYTDALASQAYIPSARVGNLSGVGDVSGSVRTAAPVYRPARVDLGMQSTKVDDTLKSIFVHRETHPLQQVNYGATRLPETPIASMPVPLAASAPQPGERFDAMPPAPVITQTETVSVPLREQSQPTNGGFMDSLMTRIAPWHAAKFGAQRTDAAATLADPIPSATVNYSEEVPSAPAAHDLPAPPRA